MKQLAVVNYSRKPFSVALRSVQVPEIHDDEDVLVEVGAVAVCGSDVHQWQGMHSWDVSYPVALGQEFAGTVVRVGARVQGFHAGDRVVCETAAVIDPHSPLTRRSLYNLDPARKGLGYGVHRAMTRSVRTSARCLHRIPPQASMVHAALAEPYSVAYNAVVNRADVRPGDCVVVLGPGPVGILCGLMAQLQGAKVAVVGLARDRGRLQIARQYGMDTFLDAPGDWGGPLGVPGVIDATGASWARMTAMQLVMPGGWITKVGWDQNHLATHGTSWYRRGSRYAVLLATIIRCGNPYWS